MVGGCAVGAEVDGEGGGEVRTVECCAGKVKGSARQEQEQEEGSRGAH